MEKVDFENVRRMRQAALQLESCQSKASFWEAIIGNVEDIVCVELFRLMHGCATYLDFCELYEFLAENPELIRNSELLFLYQAVAAERSYHQLGEPINKILVTDYWQKFFKEASAEKGIEFALTALVEVKLEIVINDWANAEANYAFLKNQGRYLIFAFPGVKASVTAKLRQDKHEFVYQIIELKKIYVD